MKNKEKINTAIIGLGNWGRKLATEFSTKTNLKYAFHQGNPQTEKWLKIHLPETKKVLSVDEILEDKEIDAVIIASPNHTHFEIAKKCIDARKDVFVEKPLCETTQEIREIEALAKTNEIIVFTGFVFLYDQAYQNLAKLLEGKKIEKIDFKWDKYGSFGNSIYTNLLVHDFAMSISLLGIPDDAESIKGNKDIKTNQIEVVTTHSKVTCNYEINRKSEINEKKVTVSTDDLKYLIKDSKLYEIHGEDMNCIYSSEISPLKNEVISFINCLKTRKEPISSPSLSLSVAQTIEKII